MSAMIYDLQQYRLLRDFRLNLTPRPLRRPSPSSLGGTVISFPHAKIINNLSHGAPVSQADITNMLRQATSVRPPNSVIAFWFQLTDIRDGLAPDPSDPNIPAESIPDYLEAGQGLWERLKTI
ncbi:MAG: hypothetical protein WC624_01910 [Candidatus Margulisiibacteriota bacterium]